MNGEIMPLPFYFYFLLLNDLLRGKVVKKFVTLDLLFSLCRAFFFYYKFYDTI